MDKFTGLQVLYEGRKVGTLELYQKYLAAFTYDEDWLRDGFAISPYSLPLEDRTFIPKMDPFDGLYGVFADSLPDGWGRLLVDRLLLKHHYNPREWGNLNRLAIVADAGMGALSYQPEILLADETKLTGYDQIAQECARILDSKESERLDELFLMGGSSGGARPKIFTRIDGEDWIIKFPAREDGAEAGWREYRYAQCAEACGIDMERSRLFPSAVCKGFFGTRRFDRRRLPDGTVGRVHMLSVSAILETSHRIPNLDYDILMRLTLELTGDFSQVEEMFRRMCFNVFAHNRDDHSKNFSFLYNPEKKGWDLAPAYDLTYSYSIGGEHATTVNGNGYDPGMEDILEVAGRIGLNRRKAREIAEWIKKTVEEYELY